MRKNFGWRRDLPDHRDLVYKSSLVAKLLLPSKVDLRSSLPPVYDQYDLGSCTGNAIAAALEFDQIKQKEVNTFTPSRLFIYYNEREIEGTVLEDSGAQIRDGLKSVANQGACSEVDWPYDNYQIKYKVKPSPNCYISAANYKALTYHSIVPTLLNLKTCLAEGFPFVLGITLYDSFESDLVAKTGIVSMPSKSESVIGGHAVLCCGYDDKTKRFTIRNSWGEGWGQAGYFTIPYAYLTNSNLTSDFWTIRSVK